NATSDQLVTMMVGRQLNAWQRERRARSSETLLAVKDLVVPGSPVGVSFEAYRGEILGFAGLVGAGRTELMQVISGAVRSQGGKMSLQAATYSPEKISDAVDAGVYLVPEDRKIHGLILSMNIAQNISLPSLRTHGPRWCFNFKNERTVAAEAV